MKKKIIILGLFMALAICFIIINNKLDLYINWNIKLPGIQRRVVIFDDFFQDGDQISIFKYYSKRKIKKIIDINHFKKISSECVQDIQEILLDFYNRLGTNIKGTNGKEVYDKNINVEKLLSTNNYYLIKRENQNESYIILILDVEDKELYTFITVR